MSGQTPRMSTGFEILWFVFSYQSNTAKDVLDTIMSIQPKDSGGGSGETRESVVTRQADDMLEKLPNDYIPHEVIWACSSF